MDHDGLAELVGERELRLEQPLLRVVRRVVAEVVEPGLADRDGALGREQLAELVEPVSVLAAGVVGMDAERRVDAVVALGELERLPRALDATSRP